MGRKLLSIEEMGRVGVGRLSTFKSTPISNGEGMGRKLLSIEEMGRVGVGRVQIIHWVCI
jgi:hypothetical protein